MNKKRKQAFRKFIDSLEGIHPEYRPPYRLLLYDKEIDGFIDVSRKAQVIDPALKTLCFLHGTAAKTTSYVWHENHQKWEYELLAEANPDLSDDPLKLAREKLRLKTLGSFTEFLDRRPGDHSFLHHWLSDTSTKYQQIIGFDHLTIKDGFEQNSVELMNLLPETYVSEAGEALSFCFEFDVDIITGSRGGPLGKYLANQFDREGDPSTGANTKIPIGNAAFVACTNGTRLLTFDEIERKIKNDRKRYKKALKKIIDELSLGNWITFLAKRFVDNMGKEIEALLKMPGLQVQHPNHPVMKEILAGTPASPSKKGTKEKEDSTSQYFPVIGKYDGSPEDARIMEKQLNSIIANVMSGYRNARFNVFGITLKASNFINADNLKQSLTNALTLDVARVLTKLIFGGNVSDMVVAVEDQILMPEEQRRKFFEENQRDVPVSVAIHSYYLDLPFENKILEMTEVVRFWLENLRLPVHFQPTFRTAIQEANSMEKKSDEAFFDELDQWVNNLVLSANQTDRQIVVSHRGSPTILQVQNEMKALEKECQYRIRNMFDISIEGIPNQSSAAKGFIGFLNRRARNKRNKEYDRKIHRNKGAIKVVSEGDSWYQYPIFLNEIVDWICKNDQIAVYSLGFGGDWVANIFTEREFVSKLAEIQPDFFMLGGGGNDLMSDKRIKKFVHAYSSAFLDIPSNYLKEDFYHFLKILRFLYATILTETLEMYPNLYILLHGYDYVVPSSRISANLSQALMNIVSKNGQWLKEPLVELNITNEELQKGIMRKMIDDFNGMLISLSNYYERVHYIDLRGIAKSKKDWWDEIHPSGKAFEKMANKFIDKIMLSTTAQD